jgi:hypothetical protein
MHDPYVYYEGEKGSRKGAGTAFYLSSTLSTAEVNLRAFLQYTSELTFSELQKKFFTIQHP